MLRRLDLALLRLLRTHGHGPAVERLVLPYTRAGEHGVLWHGLAVAGAVTDPARRDVYLRAARVVLVAYLVNIALKNVIRRARPLLEEMPALSPTITELSFPSAHSTTSFAGAAVLREALPAGPLYAAAAVMALSRVYVGVHYPSDVAAGAVLGTAMGGSSRENLVAVLGRPLLDLRSSRMKVGIVGLPNAGKSSLFNALTRAGVPAANYPFTTVEPNVAVVAVPDDRLDAVVETLGATPTTYETIEFHDIAGLVRGAHEGEGLGNKFLANIRETDAIVHVVRAHDDDQVVHPEGKVDPATDVDTIETELLYADLEQAERRLEKVVREARSGDKEKVAEESWLRALIAALQEGRPARSVPAPEAAPNAMRDLSPLTSKPVLYLANVGEGEPLEVPASLAEHAKAAGAEAVAVSARLESELAELDDDEAAAMREDLGSGESGLATVIAGAWKLLGLITFFTAGEGKEGRAWAIREGTVARRAAGSIHTDIEKGFVAAEVVSWEDLVELGGYPAARENAKLRVEGRDYVMRDGDVMTVRFTP